MNDYLNEDRLRGYLKKIFGVNFIRDIIVPNSGIKNRPDYRNDELKLIVEYDGFRHYTEPKIILADKKKDNVYSSMGYKVIRIPYFVQISTLSIKCLFDVDYQIEQSYPHGFIDKAAILPSQICSMGLHRFYNVDKNRLHSDIWKDVTRSLFDKEKYMEYDCIYPIHFDINICI